MTEQQKRELAQDTGDALGDLVLERVVGRVVDRYSAEIARLDKAVLERETGIAERNDHTAKLDKGIAERTATISELSKKMGELELREKASEMRCVDLEAKEKKLGRRIEILNRPYPRRHGHE
ncbi:MAG TPA: hypothetical protein VGR30_04345 [Candidatus Binatia bacterium]|jgi:septal ring factor EnvC (AmiA/AmiB activator)|nr:hypothetical protein [Candidatus Binatia bacterium]